MLMMKDETIQEGNDATFIFLYTRQTAPKSSRE